MQLHGCCLKTVQQSDRMRAALVVSQLPISWGTAWGKMLWLDLSINSLTGSIPDAWASADGFGGSLFNFSARVQGDLVQCTGLDLHDNALSGSLSPALAR